MKKSGKKMMLTRETVKALAHEDLKYVGGGGSLSLSHPQTSIGSSGGGASRKGTTTDWGD